MLYISAGDERPSPRTRLLELAVFHVAWEWRPQEFRILLWREDAVTIAYDGRPLPIEPCARYPVDDIPHPVLYRSFMYLPAGTPTGLAILNALSERLVVSTIHDGRCYQGEFSKGMIASLLDCVHCDCPLGTTWLTYRPDATIVAGQALTPDALHGIAERVRTSLHVLAERLGRNTQGVRVRVEDRMTKDANWG